MPSKRRSSDASDASSFVDDTAAPIFKKARTQRSKPTTTHTLESLLALPHQELAEYALSLQFQPSPLATAPPSDTWTEEKIAERALKTRTLVIAGIKKQMKWQPSCKTGKTKWSYAGMVPHEDVFYKLFGFEKPKKAWKVKKMTTGEFAERFPGVRVEVRYSRLAVTGEEVRVNWDAEEKTFKVAGTYGVGY